MLNLNRNNYEEYLLLYVDNELPEGERKAVEAFLRQNPDLEPELLLLQRTKMKPENNLVFENKEMLLKHEETEGLITSVNYEEFFLLYVDGELKAENRIKVEQFASRDPFFQKELLSFQQARLEADETLVFEGKEILYREEKRIWLLPRTWIAVAAVFLLMLAGYSLFNLGQNHEKHSSLALSDKKISLPVNQQAIKKEQPVVTAGPLHPLYPIVKPTQRPAMENKNSIEIKAPEIREMHKTVIPETVSPSLDIAKINLVPLAMDKHNIIPIADPTNAQLLPSDTEDGIDLANASESKSKMRGLFRRVSRVFEKTATAEQDKGKRGILIGGFQIALK